MNRYEFEVCGQYYVIWADSEAEAASELRAAIGNAAR